MLSRMILPTWAKQQNPELPPVVEGEFTMDELIDFNAKFYNIFTFPNHPSQYNKSKPIDGTSIDTFKYIFIDMDLKSNVYNSKEEFLGVLMSFDLEPTRIVDSGHGVHAYWQISDLDAITFVRLQRRLCRFFITDEAVGKICQLMRVPYTVNTKNQDSFVLCELLTENEKIYTSEDFDKRLPVLSQKDNAFCDTHFNNTYNIRNTDITVDDKIPLKFNKLIRENNEVKEIWVGNVDDRSTSHYRLGHIMLASGFTKDEAMSVLVNSSKAITRAPSHRINYAANIVDKIWGKGPEETKDLSDSSESIKDILERGPNVHRNRKFPCWSYFDNTQRGYRLGDVIGLVGGSGVGKTAVTLNMFMGFVQYNPDYIHYFVPLEQPADEIAERWRQMCGDRTHLYDKVRVLSNYDADGQFRHLSLEDIEKQICNFQERTQLKVGCVVIDHIGVLNKTSRNGENQALIDICKSMKAFAIRTNTLLVMQSQSPRAKAGWGDVELDKDAAYGTVFFESYCDYLITTWQPLKRCYADGAPTVTSFKFCKIRHKLQGVDKIVEDVPYVVMFDPNTRLLREITQEEEISVDFFNKQATSKRNSDRRDHVTQYTAVKWE